MRPAASNPLPMGRLAVTAVTGLVVAGLAMSPAAANPGRGKGYDPNKYRGPMLKLEADTVRVGGLLSFQCAATVENAEAHETRVDTCQAFRNGVLVAEADGAHAEGDSASTTPWVGTVPSGGTLTVCISGIARLHSGELLGHYACD